MQEIYQRIAKGEIAAGSKIFLPFEEYKVELIEWHERLNRLVILYRRKDEKVIVAKILMEKRGLILEEILRELHQYYFGLSAIGLPISTGIKFIEKLDSGYLVQLEDYGGRTVSVAIEGMSLEQAKPVIKALLRDCISPLFRAVNGQGAYMLSIGLDAALRNFVFFQEADVVVRMIDLFPPKLWSPVGGYTIEKPEPTDETVRQLGIQRHFDLSVIILTLWMHIVRANPVLGLPAIRLFIQFLRDTDQLELGKQIVDLVGGLRPRLCFDSITEIQGKVESLTFRDFHQLRTIACLLASSRKESGPLLEEFFSITHFQSDPLSLEQIEEAKRLILRIAELPKNNDRAET
ncbi:MAG: hypothetical protein A2927_01340 [Candidatus Komeilibacteria bacterium RIFCSPLOWO2_01_FULL_45_10]|uniref:Uncharacterized protein n=1 Tax=Candidatus Komeilibacteria bacterium RIFCSPLOWO2_01_FULL_45_10 TaxID=1798550 RepID=A0A1G2BLC7_9BACT|nr:MAG: hypothetical protein A2927_01340 [Candidatus Komeilibacteria bacterium RIFCSPLOWO2_01_FULL_45_10]